MNDGVHTGVCSLHVEESLSFGLTRFMPALSNPRAL